MELNGKHGPFIQESFVYEGVVFEGTKSLESVLGTKNLEGRPDDIHLTTFPRTGTTWTQNILVGLCYGTEELAKTGQEEMRYLFPYLEVHYGLEEPAFEIAKRITRSPRLLKNHMPVHLAPQEIHTHKRKNIVTFRNPKDTAISLAKFYKTKPTLMAFNKAKNLPEFLELFYQGKTIYSSWWKWSKDWLDCCRANPENNLMFHYEDLHSDFEGTVRKIANFLDLGPVSSETIQKIKELTAIDNMKPRYEKGFVNVGQLSAWKREFPPEFVKKFDEKTRQTFGDDEIVSRFI